MKRVGPLADVTTVPLLENLVDSSGGVVSGIVLFSVGIRLFGQIFQFFSTKLQIEETNRREKYLIYKLKDYHYINSPRQLYDEAQLKNKDKTSVKIQEERYIHESNSDSNGMKFSWIRPIRLSTRILPNLIPIPFFILGAYASRSLVKTKLVDLGGMEFIQDSSVLWLDNLITPDPYLAVCSGILGIIAFRASAAVRADIKCKQKYLNAVEKQFFDYSPSEDRNTDQYKRVRYSPGAYYN